MPLRACIDNQEIISVDLTDDEWNHLKLQLRTDQSSLTLPCCSGEGKFDKRLVADEDIPVFKLLKKRRLRNLRSIRRA